METDNLLDRVVNGYLTCAAWVDKPEGANPRWPKASIEKARDDCERFIAACGPLFNQAMEQTGYTPEQFGHDFWLTRCGHGTGYWDRDSLNVLTSFCITFPDRNGHIHATSLEDTLGQSLTLICYGGTFISPFAYPSLSTYRGWFYFD